MHNTTLIYEMNVVIFSGNNFPDQNVVELSLEIYIITVWNDLQKLTLLVDITVVTTMYFWNMEIIYLYVQHNPLCIVDIIPLSHYSKNVIRTYNEHEMLKFVVKSVGNFSCSKIWAHNTTDVRT